MSINLIESEHRTQKSVRSMFVSVAVHASLITLAVYATASATEVIVKAPIDSVIVFYPPNPQVPTGPPRTVTRTTIATHASTTVFHPPIEFKGISAVLPPANSSASAIDDGTLFGTGTKGDSISAGDGSTGNSGEPRFAAQVEKPAMPRNGNPSPQYPSLLESSRVEGIVLVQFVVDTLGTAEMSSFKVLDATNDLFAESTRASVAKWRFYPAEAGGRKVRQIVQLPLRFVAPRR